jgi:flavin reductase (DIM6/NTAB) family NADH-FMN oxidoreductase RutF
VTRPAPAPDGADLEGFAPETDLRAFRSALGAFATGVTVITVRDAQGQPAGITANSFASVSLDPPLVLWCPKRDSRRYDTFTQAPAFAVHVLSRDQQTVCDAFVRRAGAFDAVPWRDGPEGLPLLDGSLALFLCRREAILPAGDHSIILGRVWQAFRRDGAPLVFQGGRYGAFQPANELHPGPEAEP